MDLSFGEKLKAHYLEHIETTKSRTDNSLSTEYLRNAYHGVFEGLSDEQIEAVRRGQQIEVLPHIYVEILRVMGKHSGGIFVGATLRFEDLIELKTALIEMMDENRGGYQTIPELPESAVVFLDFQDAEFFFFDPADEPDPPVYFYRDGDSRFYRVSETLSGWFWEQAFDPSKFALAAVEQADSDQEQS